MRLLDRLETLARATVNYGPASAVRLDNVARGLMSAAGTAARTHLDSRLLKVDNRGTCQLCHDPPGTITVVGAISPSPAP